MEYDEALEKWVNDNYRNFYDFYEEIVPSGSISQFERKYKTKRIFDVLKEDFNFWSSLFSSQLEQYFDDFPVKSIRINEDNFSRVKYNDAIEVEVKVDRKLNQKEIDTLKDYLSGQYSDGWGEGFEQTPIDDWYISTWSSDPDWEISLK